MKKWYMSKTLWVNAIALAALALKGYFGFVVTPEESVALLAVANLIIRGFTKEELEQ